MAKYFSRFPLTQYNLSTGIESDIVTNLLVRFAVEKNIKDNSLLYTNYDIREGDTPEIIASKIYDSPERHWMVLLANDIIDVESDWPLTQNALSKYIDEKYKTDVILNGLEWSLTNIHSYYKVEQIVIPSSNNAKTITRTQIDVDSYDSLIEETYETLLGDGTLIVITISKESKTFYEYEVYLNDLKRNIKLFRKEFIPTLESQLKDIFNVRRT